MLPDYRAPLSSSSSARLFITAGTVACLQTSRLTLARRSDRPAAHPDTGGKYTYGEHKYWTPTPERLGPSPASSVTPSVTAIRDGCLCTLLPRLRPAWLWDAGAAVENNYFRITIGGHLQRRFTVPTAAVTGRRRRDAKHAVTAKASKPKSERVVNSGNSPASCSVISLKDSLAVICKSPAKCSAQHFPPPRRVALQEHNWNYLIGMLPSR